MCGEGTTRSGTCGIAMETVGSMGRNGWRCQYCVYICSTGAEALVMGQYCTLGGGQTLPGVVVMLLV